MAELKWRKASYSDAGQSCVEFAFSPDRAYVRDSKKPGGARLNHGPATHDALIRFVKGGSVDALPPGT
ncbi:DUF397 domain-containing protein [Lentzea sp. JNUCC 0626]|uniref:DUF397 domain-containing protein n=1 Tax=Lentzea sp. JNUCC 0626 TaxID=3367513 RepID=UPI0037487803